MSIEKLERYPLSPMVRREFLKRASLTGLVLGMAPQTAFGQTDSRSLLVKGGLVVTASRQNLVDVRMRGGKITEIGPGLTPGPPGEERVIDARGLLILPGGIDPHVHLPGSVEDLLSGSQTALAGGITTFGTMTFPRTDERVTQAVERTVRLIEEQAVVDVFLHPGLRDFEAGDQERLLDLFAAGHTSVKLQTVRPGWDLHAPQMLDLVQAAGRAGAVSLIHCEDYPIVASATDALMAAGKTSARYWAESRPVVAEVVAVQRAVALCEFTGSPVYIVHLSSQRALEACREARRRGLPLYVETRPTYLHLTDALYLGPDPGLYVANPPMRSEEDVEAMWRGFTDGEIDTLGSDHSVLMRATKADPSLTLRTLRPGFSNLEVMLPMLHSQGVLSGRISPERFVEITSTAPARLFGLYPAKGAIQVGSDADLTLWDPAEERTIRAADLHSKCDFSPYEGRQVTGWPRMSIRRGEVAYESGRIQARAGSGRLLKRGPSQKLDWVSG